jgi:glycosyltransferase involved in cell wall biosynthesis
MRSEVLILVQYYLPGFKSGGPIRSISALSEHFGDDVEIEVIAFDRDSGESSPYPSIRSHCWLPVGKSKVYYIRKNAMAIWRLLKVLRQAESDTLYLQSFFNAKFTLFPLVLCRLRVVRFGRILVAPRGELASGALGIKPKRKRLFFAFAKMVGLFRNVEWHATSCDERKEVARFLKSHRYDAAPKVYVAENLVPSEMFRLGSESPTAYETKDVEPLRVVFLSRIAPKKNLQYAIEVLRRCKVPVSFSIYGPIDRDAGYWGQCQKKIEALPEHVDVNYEGAIEPFEIPAMFREQDLLLFPTLGENFGHVIAESLMSGCPVLISDRTPWRNLEMEQVGWDLSLDDPQRFADVIEQYSLEGLDKRLAMRRRVSLYGYGKVNSKEAVEANRKMLLGEGRADGQ